MILQDWSLTRPRMILRSKTWEKDDTEHASAQWGYDLSQMLMDVLQDLAIEAGHRACANVQHYSSIVDAVFGTEQGRTVRPRWVLVYLEEGRYPEDAEVVTDATIARLDDEGFRAALDAMDAVVDDYAQVKKRHLKEAGS